jgi:hypothetical protein
LTASPVAENRGELESDLILKMPTFFQNSKKLLIDAFFKTKVQK